MSSTFLVTTFYKFVEIADVKAVRLKLYKSCSEQGILGTILLSTEGVNGTLSGPRESIERFYNTMKQIAEFNDMRYKESCCDIKPFSRLKVKIKKEIIRFDVEGLDGRKSGVHLAPQEWEKLIDSGALVLDTRNDYEIAFGTFKGAVDPNIRNFTELVAWMDEHLASYDKTKPIGMFCTGGVRCEKSTAYLIEKGFKNVYHLDGGILGYLEKSTQKQHYWIGSCFVFDDRVALDHDLKPVYGALNDRNSL